VPLAEGRESPAADARKPEVVTRQAYLAESSSSTAFPFWRSYLSNDMLVRSLTVSQLIRDPHRSGAEEK
jgi:hypothetical protein